MEKHKSFRDDSTYVRIERKWHAAYRRRERSYDSYIGHRVVTLEMMDKRSAAIEQAERALKVWRRTLDQRRTRLIKEWHAEGTL